MTPDFVDPLYWRTIWQEDTLEVSRMHPLKLAKG